MKNSRTKAGNIFASIKEEEVKEKAASEISKVKAENEEKRGRNAVDSSINNKSSVDSATKKTETMAKTTTTAKTALKQASNTEVSESDSDNPGINYLNSVQNQVETPVNNGLLYIVPTKKKTRSHRKGFLLSDLALNNLQKEAAKYEISENELINQILEKMV